MDEGEQRSFIRFLAKQVKDCSRELMAYELFAHMLKQSGYTGIDEILNQARESPALRARFDKNFERFDELLPPEDQDPSERERKLLEKWNPEDGLLN